MDTGEIIVLAGVAVVGFFVVKKLAATSGGTATGGTGAPAPDKFTTGFNTVLADLKKGDPKAAVAAIFQTVIPVAAGGIEKQISQGSIFTTDTSGADKVLANPSAYSPATVKLAQSVKTSGNGWSNSPSKPSYTAATVTPATIAAAIAANTAANNGTPLLTMNLRQVRILGG